MASGEEEQSVKLVKAVEELVIEMIVKRSCFAFWPNPNEIQVQKAPSSKPEDAQAGPLS